MALAGKLETEVHIDAPADKFYNVWKNQCFNLPTASPSTIREVDVAQGDWGTGGSVKLWKYTIEGRTETFKEKVEVDDDNMTITLIGIDGDIFKDFKSWKPAFKLTPKGSENGSVAKLRIEYEKRNSNVRDPKEYMDFMASMTKDVSAHLMQTCN